MDDVMADAEARYRAGDYAGASALLAGPDPAASSASLRLLGLCRLRLGVPGEALDLLTRAHALAPDDPWANLHHGIGLQAVGRHVEAITLFRAAQALLPLDPAPLLNLSTSLLAVADVAGAITAARRGRLRGVAMAESHYTLGVAYLAGGFLDRAKDSFRRAAKLAPDFADAWVNLGVALYRNGEIEAAKRAMRAALEIAPGNAAAATNLSTFLRLTGHGEAAEALLVKVIETAPDTAAARINLAAGLLGEDGAIEALALLDGAVPGDPLTRQHWGLQRALALVQLGRTAEARAVTAAIGAVHESLAPMLQWRLVLLALAEGDRAQATRHAAAMAEALEAGGSQLPEHRIMGHYELARLWSKLREPDKAFPHWVEGHRQLARFQPFSRDAYAAYVDATIATFDTARLRQGARAGNRDAAPVFIVGMPRSGTTLLEQILDAHAEVHGAGERHALGQEFFRLGGAAETASAVRRIAALQGPALDACAERYLSELHALAPDASRIVDKMPGNFRHLGLVGLLLPGARVIACDRDPRDIGLSIFTYRFYGVHPYAHDLSDLGWYIGQQHRLMAHWRAVLPIPMMTVRLQDWIEDFSGTLGAVLDFLGLPYDPACERFHEVQRRVRTVSRDQVRQKVNARGIGRWREYERHLAPLIASLRESGALV